jgi:hypothetical protein
MIQRFHPTMANPPVFTVNFKGGEHVHGPDCKHDHAHPHDHFENSHAHTHPKTKPGDRYKNPVMRAIVNFFGWFYELGASFIRDIRGVKADEAPPHTEHRHPHFA